MRSFISCWRCVVVSNSFVIKSTALVQQVIRSQKTARAARSQSMMSSVQAQCQVMRFMEDASVRGNQSIPYRWCYCGETNVSVRTHFDLCLNAHSGSHDSTWACTLHGGSPPGCFWRDVTSCFTLRISVWRIPLTAPPLSHAHRHVLCV